MTVIPTINVEGVLRQWHTVLPSSMEGTIGPGGQEDLSAEYALTSLALRMDLLYVRQDKPVGEVHPSARAFRKHNIIEYKSPNDPLDDKGYNQGIIYTRPYQNRRTPEDKYFEDISLTFICTKEPKGLFTVLGKLRRKVVRDSPVPGIFQIYGEQHPVQIVVLDLFVDREIVFPFAPQVSSKVRIGLRLMPRLMEEFLHSSEIKCWRKVLDFCIDNLDLTKEEIKEMVEMLKTKDKAKRMEMYADMFCESRIGQLIREKGREESIKNVIRVGIQNGVDVGLLAELTGSSVNEIRQMLSVV